MRGCPGDVSESVWQLLGDEIGVSGDPIPVAGGCINHCAIITLAGSGRQVFAKGNSADKLSMFEAEAHSLSRLASARAVLVPEPVRSGVIGDFSFLLMSYVPIGRGTPYQFRTLGKQVAALHREVSGDGRFGWSRDNFIGATPQPNAWDDDWARFFAHRIAYQLQLADRASGRGGIAHGEKLVARIPDLLGGHEPAPSLLHGDLWSGNAGFTLLGTPVIFDPACYFGDRETDIAFSEMFGGFDREFYRGYRSVYPLEDGYEQRRDLYNLYHVLNHYNLFGGGYGQQAEATIRRLLVGF